MHFLHSKRQIIIRGQAGLKGEKIGSGKNREWKK